MISFADLHSDTLYKCFVENRDLSDKLLHINVSSLNQFDSYITTFAHYIPEKETNKWGFLLRFLDHSKELLERHNIPIFSCGNDIDAGKCAILSVEGGDIFPSTFEIPERVSYLKQQGISFFSMIYNHTNALGCGAYSESDSGLTEIGYCVLDELIGQMIVPDISHASFQSAKNILSYVNGPVCATHSNAYAVTASPRNLPDDILREISKKDGLIGVNLYPPFLSSAKHVSIDDIVFHIRHLVNVCGFDHVVFGCDFDGVECLPKEILGVDSMYQIYDKLVELGFDFDTIDKIFFNNIKEFLKANFRR